MPIIKDFAIKHRWLFALFLFLVPPSPAFAQEDTLSPDEIALISQAVVRIEVYQGGIAVGSGSGTLVLPTGLIYTNRHVVELGDEFQIAILEDPNELPVPRYKASFVLAFSDLDFAALQIDRTLGGLPLAPESLNLPYLDALPVQVQRGEKLYTFGYPGIGNGFLVLTQGQVTTIQNGDVNGERMPVLYQTDAEISPGMSGGLAVNARGEYVGLPTKIASEAQTGGRLGGILPLVAVEHYLDSNGETLDSLEELAFAPSTQALDYLNSCQRLAYGEKVQGRINNVFWAEFYCFEGQAGDQITLDMSITGGNLDGLLVIFDSRLDEAYVYNDDRSANDSSPLIEKFELPQTSTYIILATRYGLETGASYGEFSLDLALSNRSVVGSAPSFVCPNGLMIQNGISISVVQMRPGFGYTATVLGLGDFDPILALGELCVDNSPEAATYALNLPTTGQVTGNNLGAHLPFSQDLSDFADVDLVVGGGSGEFVLIIEGMAVTAEDNLGDPFRVFFQPNLAMTVYMLALDRGLDSYVYVWDSQINNILRDRQGAMLLCDDGGSRSTCWGRQQGLAGSSVTLKGQRVVARSSDSMLTLPLNVLAEDTVNYLMTSYNYETQGRYVVVFHVRLN